MKNLGPRANERTIQYLENHFNKRNTGAEYILAALPVAARKFIGLDIKGKFTADELRLMIDAMNDTQLSPEMAGQHLLINVLDRIAIEKLDQKWGVEGKEISNKLSEMSAPELMIIELWIQGFWQAAPDQDLNEYIQVAL